MLEDYLGLPPEEAKSALAEAGYQVVAVKSTGGQNSSPSEAESRVVRVRVVGAGQVELVLAPVYTQPPAKGGVGTYAPSDY
ncbi:MAG: hypothetical protein ACPLQP_11320 [Moorellaceae bacterium]